MAAETPTQKSEEVDGKTSGSVTDFLVAPKKKRKNYVVLAFGDNFDSDLAKSVEAHIRSQHPQLAIAIPRNPTELGRLMSKLISLLIIFDEFYENMDKTLDAVAFMKRKKSSDGLPTLFVTHDEGSLIKKYHEQLLPFHETDELVSLRNLHVPVLFMRIRSALRGPSKRRSRRFDFQLPVTYFDLNSGKVLNGTLEEISLHGGLLKSLDGNIFAVGDQVRLNVNVAKVQRPNEGEFLRVSAKVRRLYISGSQAGVSFEFLNERQMLVLTQLLSLNMNRQMAIKRAMIQMPKKNDDPRPAVPKSAAKG